VFQTASGDTAARVSEERASVGRRSLKGGVFERDICRELSLWWTRGGRDDVFWRTSGSGARATTRAKRGKRTFGHYGDVLASDPIGQPLIDLLTIELKKGYNKHSPYDALDKPDTHGPRPWEKWVAKARDDSGRAGSFGWMLIWKRDRRKPIVFIPRYIWLTLLTWWGPHEARKGPWVHMHIRPETISSIPLEEFFKIPPEALEKGKSVWKGPVKRPRYSIRSLREGSEV
jgi:hypothetical protein